jgi:hypothetical protein
MRSDSVRRSRPGGCAHSPRRPLSHSRLRRLVSAPPPPIPPHLAARPCEGARTQRSAATQRSTHARGASALLPGQGREASARGARAAAGAGGEREQEQEQEQKERRSRRIGSGSEEQEQSKREVRRGWGGARGKRACERGRSLGRRSQGTPSPDAVDDQRCRRRPPRASRGRKLRLRRARASSSSIPADLVRAQGKTTDRGEERRGRGRDGRAPGAPRAGGARRRVWLVSLWGPGRRAGGGPL